MNMQRERPPREKDWNTVVADDLRPAGNGKDCFYCGIPLGGQHKDDCVIRECAGQYTVAIRKNDTGEIRLFRYDMEWDDTSMYQWTDGNFSCDCNRKQFWYRAIGEEVEDHECGDTAFSVLYAELPDGTRIEIDEPVEQTT